MPEFDETFVLKFRIRFGHRVVTDDQLFSERANAWKLIAVLKDTSLDRVPDLLHQLQIERLPGGWIKPKGHKSTVPLIVYSELAICQGLTGIAGSHRMK